MRIDFYSISSFEQVQEFHNIMPIDNIPSVIEHGILSHEKASKLLHADVSMAEVQDLRAEVQVTNGMKLHKYANLYFHARNPMMYVRRTEEVCILRVLKDVSILPGVVFSDRNASSNYTNFCSIGDTADLYYETIFSKYWNDDDPIITMINKSMKCAEILVPDRVDYGLIFGAYVKNAVNKQKLFDKGFTKPIEIYSELFFQ